MLFHAVNNTLGMLYVSCCTVLYDSACGPGDVETVGTVTRGDRSKGSPRKYSARKYIELALEPAGDAW